MPRGIAGSTLGIVGFGNIGQALAVRARPLGVRIIAVARLPRAAAEPADELLTPEQLPRLLRASDFVVVAVPLTAATHGLIGRDQLALMRPGAWLIDISGRAAIVDQNAVIEALGQGVIGGAELQFAAPPPPHSPLWDMDNLIMSQYSANSEEEARASVAMVIDNIRRSRAGRPLRGLVDKVAGY